MNATGNICRIGLIQLAVKSLKSENLHRIIDIIDSSELSELLVFPEYCMGYPNERLDRNYLEKNAEPIDGEFVSTVARKSREKQVAVVLPIFEKRDSAVFNTAVVIDCGDVKGGYRKMHLFDALSYRESDFLSSGSNGTVFRIGGMTYGVVLCYDIRFPELVKSEVLAGARTILVPSAWYRGPLKEEQWQTLLMARAQENTSYVVGVGNANDAFVGRSIVADPFGLKMLDLGSGDRIGYCMIDNDRITEAREKLPVLVQSGKSLNVKCERL